MTFVIQVYENFNSVRMGSILFFVLRNKHLKAVCFDLNIVSGHLD